MTIQINTPVDGTGVVIPANYQVTGTNDTGDDVCGFIYDITSGNIYISTAETLDPDPNGGWDWTLTFPLNPVPANNDYLLVYIYDAETGGDGDSVIVQQTGGARQPPAAAAPANPPSIGVQPVAISPTGVHDITLTVSLQPVGVKGSIFLVLLKDVGNPQTAHRAVLHHHLPPPAQPNHPVTFRTIKMDDWGTVLAITVLKRHLKNVRPHITPIK